MDKDVYLMIESKIKQLQQQNAILLEALEKIKTKNIEIPTSNPQISGWCSICNESKNTAITAIQKAKEVK